MNGRSALSPLPACPYLVWLPSLFALSAGKLLHNGLSPGNAKRYLPLGSHQVSRSPQLPQAVGFAFSLNKRFNPALQKSYMHAPFSAIDPETKSHPELPLGLQRNSLAMQAIGLCHKRKA